MNQDTKDFLVRAMRNERPIKLVTKGNSWISDEDVVKILTVDGEFVLLKPLFLGNADRDRDAVWVHYTQIMVKS